MGKSSRVDDKTEEADAAFQGSGRPTGFENFKNFVADKLHRVAEAIDENASNQDAQSGMAQGRHISDWLDQSAGYVRQFDYELANAKAREYIGQNPGRCLLMAGAAGLIIGAILRRR